MTVSLRILAAHTSYLFWHARPITTMTGALKRKRDGASASKFYAVRNGRQPGIFSTWSECFKSVNGFANAIYKSFSSESDAQAFLRGVDATTKPKPTKHDTGVYAVRLGRIPGIYSSWQEAAAQVQGFNNAVYRKFDTRADAARMTTSPRFSQPELIAIFCLAFETVVSMMLLTLGAG